MNQPMAVRNKKSKLLHKVGYSWAAFTMCVSIIAMGTFFGLILASVAGL